MSNQCLIGCKCNSNSRNFDPHMQVRPNLGAIELDYDVEMPTNFIKGLDGKSAYEYAVKGGYKYSEFQFYKDLAGVGGIEPPEIRLLADSIKIGEDITVYTGDPTITIGGYKDGDVIPANATLLDVLKGIFKRIIEYIYTEPTLNIDIYSMNEDFTNTVTPLIGNPIYLTLTLGYTRGDAGFVSMVKLDHDTHEIYTSSTLDQLNRIGETHIDRVDKEEGLQSFNISVTGVSYATNNEFVLRAPYGEGAVHNNSEGVESPGHILAGAFSEILRINAIYPILYSYSNVDFDSSNLLTEVENPLIYKRIPYDPSRPQKLSEFLVPSGIKSLAIIVPKFSDSTESQSVRVAAITFDILNQEVDTLQSFTIFDNIDNVPITYMGMNYVAHYVNLDTPIQVRDTCKLRLSYS